MGFDRAGSTRAGRPRYRDGAAWWDFCFPGGRASDADRGYFAGWHFAGRLGEAVWVWDAGSCRAFGGGLGSIAAADAAAAGSAGGAVSAREFDTKTQRHEEMQKQEELKKQDRITGRMPVPLSHHA